MLAVRSLQQSATTTTQLAATSGQLSNAANAESRQATMESSSSRAGMTTPTAQESNEFAAVPFIGASIDRAETRDGAAPPSVAVGDFAAGLHAPRRRAECGRRSHPANERQGTCRLRRGDWPTGWQCSGVVLPRSNTPARSV